jgi:hypothetical protein
LLAEVAQQIGIEVIRVGAGCHRAGGVVTGEKACADREEEKNEKDDPRDFLDEEPSLLCDARALLSGELRFERRPLFLLGRPFRGEGSGLRVEAEGEVFGESRVEHGAVLLVQLARLLEGESARDQQARMALAGLPAHAIGLGPSAPAEEGAVFLEPIGETRPDAEQSLVGKGEEGAS